MKGTFTLIFSKSKNTWDIIITYPREVWIFTKFGGCRLKDFSIHITRLELINIRYSLCILDYILCMCIQDLNWMVCFSVPIAILIFTLIYKLFGQTFKKLYVPTQFVIDNTCAAVSLLLIAYCTNIFNLKQVCFYRLI